MSERAFSFAHWQSLHRDAVALDPGLGTLPLEGLLRHPASLEPHRLEGVMHNMLANVGQPPKKLLLLHGFVFGGVERVAAHAAQAVASRLAEEELLVLATDQPGVETLDWFAGAGRALSLPQLEPEPLDFEDRALLLARLIHVWKPKAVLNLHSAAGWRALERFGSLLAQPTQWSAGLFCRDRLPNGLPISHADRYLRGTLQWLESLFCDHQLFLDQLSKDYALDPKSRSKLQVLYQPVQWIDSGPHPTGDNVLWAGRICEQKRPDLLAQVALLQPHRRFDVYGPGVCEDQWRQWGLDQCPNVKHCGPYRSFSDLPLESYMALLFTSDYEGLPNVLLEAGAAGLPLVARAVGGVPELITDHTGWPVSPDCGAEGLALALDHLQQNPGQAQRRVQACRALLARRHSQHHYLQSASRISTFFRGSIG